MQDHCSPVQSHIRIKKRVKFLVVIEECEAAECTADFQNIHSLTCHKCLKVLNTTACRFVLQCSSLEVKILNRNCNIIV